MAARSNAISVTTTAVPLNNNGETDDNIGCAAVFYNDGSVTAYLGGGDVTASGAKKGYPLVAGGEFAIEVTDKLDIVFARTASGTTTIIVFELGV